MNLCPSLPFSDVALVSQVVGVPSLAEDGGAAGEELSGEVLVWPPRLLPALLFSFLSFEQPALVSTIAASRSTTQPVMIRRACFDWYDGVTKVDPFDLSGVYQSAKREETIGTNPQTTQITRIQKEAHQKRLLAPRVLTYELFPIPLFNLCNLRNLWIRTRLTAKSDARRRGCDPLSFGKDHDRCSRERCARLRTERCLKCVKGRAHARQ